MTLPKLSARRLLLIALDYTRPKDPPISLGQASILANLKKHNVDVLPNSYAVNHDNFKSQNVIKFALDNASKSTDIALGAFVWNEKALQEILSTLKRENFPGRIILGGPQISYVKKGVEKYYPQADIFIRGYAEEAMAQLFTATKEKPEIAGIHYAGDIDKGVSAEADLEKLPSPFLNGIIAPQRFIRFETQRGCPFRCSFCQHRESDVSKKRRGFALNRIMQEIDWITQNKIIQDIAVLDPTFNSGNQYLQVMDRFIEGKYSGKLSLQIRLEMITPEFLDRVTELNKTGLVVLEAGLQTIHKNEQKLIDRPSNMTRINAALSEIKQRKIENEISLIFGLPGQTVKSFQESVDFCINFGANKVYAFPLMLLRGTPLFDMKKTLQIKESDDINLEKINRLQTDIPHVIESFSFNQDDWKKMVEIAQSLDNYNKDKPAPRLEGQAITATQLNQKTEVNKLTL